MKDNRVARLNILGGGTRTGLREAYRELISISRNLSSRDWLKRLRRMEYSVQFQVFNAEPGTSRSTEEKKELGKKSNAIVNKST